jgi:sarcosine oxidase
MADRNRRRPGGDRRAMRYTAVTTYDVIVLGVGGVGSAALYHCAGRAARVLGIEQFSLAHDRGSSHGHTRLIRQAYFEHPDYVPLVQRAFTLWADLEAAAGETIYHESGLLEIGPPDGEVIRGVRHSARLHGLEIDNLSATDARSRFAGFVVPEACDAIFERRAGYLLVERAIEAHARLAVRAGARLITDQVVRGWRIDGHDVVVETDTTRYRAGRLIVAAGAWSSPLLMELGILLEIRRKPLYWWNTRDDTYAVERGCPGFLYDLPRGCFYGFPQIETRGIKVAEHTGGDVVDDPLAVDRGLNTSDRDRVASFVRENLPAAVPESTDFTVCMYTMTPDANFVVDRHPRYPQVAFAAGLSGHGFKFTCVLGEALADLALAENTNLPIGFLSATRPALRLAHRD